MTVIERLQKKKEQMHAEIKQRYTCTHLHRELRRRVIADGRPVFYRQCVHCGHAGNAIPAKVADGECQGLPIAEFDYDADSRWEKAKSDEYSHVAWEINHEFDLIYEDYLLSRAWRILRAAVLERSGGFCEVCEDRPAVTAHHKSYKNLCCEPLEDLTAVCQSCHELLHKKHPDQLKHLKES